MQTYSKTKDSEVEWLGRIPQEWSLSKISANFRRKKIRGMVNEELLSVYRDYGVVIKSSRDDNHNAASEDLSNYQLVEAGDLVTNKMKTWQGSIAISEYRGIVSPAYFILSPTSTKMVPKYIHYLLRSPIYIAQYNRFSKGIRIGQWDLEYEQFKTFPLLLPPHEIQQKIADFLDTETAQIDNLIAKQERLLELLEEKRRATITHAVTRGLNPSVELKETNIPWLGQIPAHWSVVRVKDIADIVLGKMVQNEQKNTEEVLKPYLKSRNIQWNGIDLSSVDEMWFKPNEIQCYSLLDDDIVVSEGGDVGKCVMWREEFGEMYFQNSVNRVRVAENTEAKYVYYVFQHFALNQVFMNTVNKVSIAHLTKDKIATYHIPMPNEAEQERIADYLDTEDTKFRELKQKIQTQIALLRERRTSLISHAVTGKIKI